MRILLSLLFFTVTNVAFGQVTVNMNNISGQQGAEITIPVTINSPTSINLDTLSINFNYDNQLIHIYGYSLTGSLLSNTTNNINIRTGSGNAVSVRVKGNSSFSGQRTLITLNAKIVGSGTNMSGLTTSMAIINSNVSIPNISRSISTSPGNPITVTIGTNTFGTNSSIEIPVSISNVTNSGIYSYRYEINYPANLIEIQSAVLANTISQGGQIVTNPIAPGRFIVVYANNTPLSSSGILFRLRGRSLQSSGTGQLVFQEKRLNSGYPDFNTVNGTVIVNISTSDELDIPELPEKTSLNDSFPNPFNPTTVIPFELKESGDITLSIIDSVGRLVAVLVKGYVVAGAHQLQWNASNLPSGIYMIRLEAGGEVYTNKVTLIK